MRSCAGSDSTNDGERCSMVTLAAPSASAGTRVTAVAPLPMTTTLFPATSRSSGQCCGCTTVPVNVVEAGPVGRVSLVVAVVAGANVQERAGAGGPYAGLGVLRRSPSTERPHWTSRHVPPGCGSVMCFVHAVRGGGLPDVAQDLLPTDDRLPIGPRPERVAEREHVRVRAHARDSGTDPRCHRWPACLDDRVRRAGRARSAGDRRHRCRTGRRRRSGRPRARRAWHRRSYAPQRRCCRRMRQDGIAGAICATLSKYVSWAAEPVSGAPHDQHSRDPATPTPTIDDGPAIAELHRLFAAPARGVPREPVSRTRTPARAPRWRWPAW